MVTNISGNWPLALLITYATSSILVQGQSSPKSEIEDVPGIIKPISVGRVCMHRQNYDCRWSYEKSCSCNLLKRLNLRHIVEITFIRIKNKENKNISGEIDDSKSDEDTFIQF